MSRGLPVCRKRYTTFRWRNMECFTHLEIWKGRVYWHATHARTGIRLTCLPNDNERQAIEEAIDTLRGAYKDLKYFPSIKPPKPECP
jgi:hypothetical protein